MNLTDTRRFSLWSIELIDLTETHNVVSTVDYFLSARRVL